MQMTITQVFQSFCPCKISVLVATQTDTPHTNCTLLTHTHTPHTPCTRQKNGHRAHANNSNTRTRQHRARRTPRTPCTPHATHTVRHTVRSTHLKTILIRPEMSFFDKHLQKIKNGKKIFTTSPFLLEKRISFLLFSM